VVFPNWLPVKIGMFIKIHFPKLAVKLWGSHLKPFPSFIPKTDEDRLQIVPKVLNRHKEKTFYVTEKVDGSSLTFFHNNGKVGVCSRNIWYPKDYSNQFWKAIIHLNIEDKFKKLGNYALQGELVGESIQDNQLLIKGQRIYFFNVYNISTGKYLPYKEFIAFCKDLGVETVPVLDDNFKLKKTVDDMVEYATRKSVITKDVWVEGVVIRPLEEAQDKELGRLSFKVVNPEFLLKYGE
jgi:RNA ligase (TIGR02306 family)